MPYKAKRVRFYIKGKGPKSKAARKIQRMARRKSKRNLAKKVAKLNSKVNKIIEKRWNENGTYTFSIPGAGGAVETIGLDLIAQGDTVSSRTGDKITLTKLDLRGQLVVADTHNFVRLVLVQVLSLNQIVIPSDVLQPDAVTNNPTLYSPYTKDSRIKFDIIHDKFYKLQQQAAGAVYPEIVNVDLSYTWKNGLTITYPSQTAGNVTPIYNNIVLLVLSDSQVAGHPSFRGFRRTQWIA